VSIVRFHPIAFSNGRIVEHWGEADTVGMLLQMGMDPFRSVAAV